MPHISPGELRLFILALEDAEIQTHLLEIAKFAPESVGGQVDHKPPLSPAEAEAKTRLTINMLRNHLWQLLAGHARSGESIRLGGLLAEELTCLAQVTEALEDITELSQRLLQENICDGYLSVDEFKKLRYGELAKSFLTAQARAERAIDQLQHMAEVQTQRSNLFGRVGDLTPFRKAALTRSPATHPFPEPSLPAAQSTVPSPPTLQEVKAPEPDFKTIREILTSGASFDPGTWESLAEQLIHQGFADDLATAMSDLTNPDSFFRRTLSQNPDHQDLAALFTREAEWIESLTRYSRLRKSEILENPRSPQKFFKK